MRKKRNHTKTRATAAVVATLGKACQIIVYIAEKWKYSKITRKRETETKHGHTKNTRSHAANALLFGENLPLQIVCMSSIPRIVRTKHLKNGKNPVIPVQIDCFQFFALTSFFFQQLIV